MLPFKRLGPYIVEAALGSGGMGTVYLGVDEQTGERVAVKVLSPALAADPSFRERFGTEIETLKKLRHPHIVQLLGYGEQDGQLFYAMEMIEGRTLQQELHAGRRFQWREVTRIGIQTCQALKHAHDRGIIHRDLKPANLLYTAAEQIKLADFGIAKLYGMTQLTVAGGVIGTVDFMSPEQGDGKPVTARSDLYSLGSVLFALLAGRPPFASRSAAEVIHKLKYEEAPRIRRLVPETPKEFEVIISQLLEKDPAQRIATARAVANRLMAMEHALSPETRVAADSDEFDLAPADDFRPGPDEEHAAPAGTAETGVVTPLERLTDAAAEGLEQHHKSTVAMPPELLSLVPPPVRAETSTTHFTTFDEAARQRAAAAAAAPQDAASPWLKIAPPLAAVLLVVLALWYFSRPPSAEMLYQKIMAVARDGETSQLTQVEADIDTYLQRFPGAPQHAEVQELRDELNSYRLQRRYERRARLRTGSEKLGPVESAYVDATRVATTDPLAASEQLQALIDVYVGAAMSEQDQRCLALASEQLRELEATGREHFARELELIQQRLDAADAMAPDSPDRAHAIRHGIVAIYGAKSWAQPAVERARAALAEPAAPQPPEETPRDRAGDRAGP